MSLRSAAIARVTVVAFGLLTALTPAAARAAEGPVVRFTTSLGSIDVRLLGDAAPKTVANFLGYVERRDYDGSFFHRSVKDFVIQGGGYTGDADAPKAIPAKPAVVNEFKESNRRGTLAMAKVDGNPDSATNQWFFNTAENAGNLDANNGGFTVFGRVTDAAGLKVMDAIAALPIREPRPSGPFETLPVRDWTSGPVGPANLVRVTSVAVLPSAPVPAPAPALVPSRAPRRRPPPRRCHRRLGRNRLRGVRVARVAAALDHEVLDRPVGRQVRRRRAIGVAGRGRPAGI